ncbi:MAG: alpha-2-macroglobulin family protein, partial [Hyphomicrobiaceae bacterium]
KDESLERGVYKPGETMHLTAIVRDKNAKAPRPMPVTLVAVRPDEGHGGRVYDYALSATAMTGTWRVRVYADPKAPAIGEKAILVEDFVPERLDMTLEPEAPALASDEARFIAVKGRYLYGPPAANLAIEGEVLVRQRSQGLEAWKGFRFGLEDEKLSPQRKELDGSLKTNDKGEARIPVELPPLPQSTRLLEAQVALRLREPSGRSIERTIVLPVERREPMIGLKPLFDPREAGDGKTLEFEVIMLGPDGKRIASNTLNWQLKRIEHRWQWYSRDGSWNYEGVKTERKLRDGKLSVRADKSARIAVPIEWGRYKLEVSAEGRNGPVTTVLFSSGWWAADNADSPEALDIALDKAKYKTGETARLTINGLGAGKALVTVVGRGLLSTREIEVKGRGTTVDLMVTEDWGTGVYVTATLYRPLDEKLKRMPSRSLGLKWVEIDRETRSIKVTLAAPDKLSGSGRLRVPVKLEGLSPGEDARLVVSAVDVGILNLTRFEAPDPQKFFYSQRKLPAEIRDLYGRLIDGMRAQRGKLRQGGDSDTNTAMKIEGSPQVEKPVALFSGLVRPDDNGNAVVEFDLPPFNGTVRLSAVAWSAVKLGSSKTDVVVREPVALLVSGPRFMTLGDEVRLVVDLHNVDGKAGPYKVSLVSVPGPDTKGEAATVTAREVALKAGERKLESIMLKAERIGLMHYEVRVAGPEGIALTRPLTYAVKPPSGDIRRMTVATLNPNGKMTLSADLLADVLPEKARLSLSVGPAIGIDLVGLLLSLDRYPYGCAEQTTSRAMPLVYLNDLARIAGLGEDKAVKARVQGAIERVLEMQASSGAFGVWGPRDADMWLTAYVTDFLTRAKEAGFTVPQKPLSLALDRLQNAVNTAGELESGGEDIAYALYVLARNGRAPVGELRYNVDTRLDKFGSALAKTQLGAALAMLGDKARAQKAFKAAIAELEVTDDQSSRSDYGSKLRDGAALITLASETSMVRSESVGLRQVLTKAIAARSHVSTQEQAWMLLAARALIEDAKDATATINGRSHKGPLFRSLEPKDLKAGPITIANTSSRSSQVVVTVTGDAATPEPAIAKGFKIVREYYTLDGKPFDLASASGGKAELKQNQRLVAVLRIEAEGDERTGRLLLVDRLPAGLEIENPRLVDSASIKSLPWLKDAMQPAHTEFRDDRFVAAFDLFPKKNGEEKAGKLVMAYMVRAVTPGIYLHPAATIEDMYRPERFARTAAGRLEVKAME